ncbi:type I restriction endonuclease subunit R [Lactobacillaceae bacterium L1_55_11]|nr:type I restriction endonuclease subunit R [Lactobacillaceae bacterium L1_55_11]
MTKKLTPELQALLERGQAEHQAGNWHQAAETFAELYQAWPAFDSNYRLVTALFMDHQYQLAADYADDFLSDYLEDVSHFKLVVAIAVQNHNFVDAQQLVMTSEDADLRKELLAGIRADEKEASETMVTTFKTVARQFYHMSDYDLPAQHERYQAAHYLPVDQFVTGAKFLLVDPYTLPVMRATLLEDLAKLGVSDELGYRWVDGQNYQAQINDLPLAVDSPQYRDIVAFLAETVGQQDPIAYENLVQQTRMELTLLFPMIEPAVSDPKAWAQVNLSNYYQEDSTAESAGQASIHRQVQQVLNEMMS